jgi:hypothetical protein
VGWPIFPRFPCQSRGYLGVFAPRNLNGQHEAPGPLVAAIGEDGTEFWQAKQR